VDLGQRLGVRAWPRPAGWQWVLIAAGLVVVLVGAGAAAAARFGDSAPRILVGVRVAGEQATAVVAAAAHRLLERTITVRAAGRTWWARRVRKPGRVR
jgi:hypothetical protein